MEKKHKRSETEAQGENSLVQGTDTKRDCISTLPDEILSSIISLLTTRDVARASLASRRWRDICASVPNLIFSWRNMFATPENQNIWRSDRDLCQLYKDVFLKSVDQYLKFYVGPKVGHFGFALCVGRDHACYLDRWISFAVGMDVERFEFGCSCVRSVLSRSTVHSHDELYVFPCHLLSRAEVSKLKYLSLRSCILGPNLTDQFSTLNSLVLIRVPLSERDVQSIFSSCFKLEFLALEDCGLPAKLRICGSLRRLKFVTVCRCSGVKDIELSGNSLTNFDYIGGEVELSFLELPNLEKVYFRVPCGSGYEYIFSQVARSLPRIKTLSVFTRTHQLEALPGNLTAFSKINHLELYFYLNNELDTQMIIAILRACPLLQKFYIETRCPRPAHDEQSGEYGPAEEIHHHLKEVEIGGFCSTRNQIGFAIYLLKHAVALERMVINPQSKLYRGSDSFFLGGKTSWDEGERKRVYEQLQEKVHSKNAAVVIL